MKKICPECGDTFTGRIDKKFCSDQCRNTYNNRLNKDETNFIRNVNHVLRKNRRILAELNPEGKARVSKSVLIDKGFNFQYFTNIYTTKNGKTYYFCYDHGYLPIVDDYYMLVIRQEYVGRDG
ncbi:MAG TPA: hypothetical protein P5050_11535 [Bacteroidia bacterium]|nr:hypothetical protein [Bacteroidia bacterium]HRS59837.1 hypothetical protein [Bacteroidia bacterium]HRU68934.1 hypothetical protein [Bacteroidia bacterium]